MTRRVVAAVLASGLAGGCNAPVAGFLDNCFPSRARADALPPAAPPPAPTPSGPAPSVQPGGGAPAPRGGSDGALPPPDLGSPP